MELKIQLSAVSTQVELFGPADAFLRLVRENFGVIITVRDGDLIINGEDEQVKSAADVIDRMERHLLKTGSIEMDDVRRFIQQRESGVSGGPGALQVFSGKVIEPSTKGQLDYIEKMLKNDLTFCIGPAGTGKTYLAVAVAVAMLKRKQVRRLILARPAVEAGEKLGFLPGDIQAKVNPYLRPLFDSIGDMMSLSQMKKLMDLDVIEIIPLAFMRGRTLNESVIICDEAQNTSPLQMLMVLTRLGQGSKMVITGDITQSDIAGQESGMAEAMHTLRGLKNIGMAELSKQDIVRHKLVQEIVEAYSARHGSK